MTTITIEQAGKYDGQEVTLKGWLYNLRESGKLLFPIFRDGTGIIQGVCALRENPEAFESLKGLTQESSVIVTGKIRAEKRAPGGFEIGVTKIQIVQKVPESTPFPIQLKEHGVDFLLDHRHLWIRTPRQAAILRIRAEAIRAAREYMDGQGYTLTDAPMFTPAACEGTSTLFEVNYIDDQKAYLTQSGQLYIEATAMALGKVYTFGPAFRAEKSKTRRHLTEFWMLEPEAAYVELDEVMALGEGLVSAIVQSVVKNKSRELETLKRDARKLENVKPPFPRISYEEAVAVLNKHGNPAKFGDDFGGDEETIISSAFDRPVMVHRYPVAIKAFYMQPDTQRPDLALAFDVLAPEGYGEIIGVPMDLGQSRRGVDMGPSALRGAGLQAAIKKLGVQVEDIGNLSVKQPEEMPIGEKRAKYLQEIAETCGDIAAAVEKSFAVGFLPLVLGGDHSIAVGVAAGVANHFRKDKKQIGYLWLDAHGDMNTPESSPSGNVHGMPLAAIMGYGAPELVDLLGFKPKAEPSNIVIVGARDLDAQERKIVKKSGVHVFTMRDIDERGMRDVMSEALKYAMDDTAGIAVSLDMDFVDPADAPGVGTPVRGGVTYREAHLAMEMIADTESMVSLEVVLSGLGQKIL